VLNDVADVNDEQLKKFNCGGDPYQPIEETPFKITGEEKKRLKNLRRRY
jgi:hypothetical protein|tara:strand:- start:303 stop:449 length:147 start_codon:yes stop_codon:yes gene_type:complete